MFKTRPQNYQTNVQGIDVIFAYPTLNDEIRIEARKQVLSMGQYASLSLSPMASSQGALDLTDAIAELSMLCKFPNNPELNLELLFDEEGRNFILECHKAYQEWRNSFRKKPERTVEQQGESGQDNKE